MSSKCGLKLIFMSIIFIIIVNGYAKDISGVERGKNRLNEYISHYETLNYDHEKIKSSHTRARRSVTKDHSVYLKFSAHGRQFHIRLKRDLSTFNDNLEILDSRNVPIDVNRDHIYVGDVIGDRNSYVFGSILDGVFEGKIITERDAYYVEHAKRYFSKNHYEMPTTISPALPIALKRTAAEEKFTHENYKKNYSNSQAFNENITTTNTNYNNNNTASTSTFTKNKETEIPKNSRHKINTTTSHASVNDNDNDDDSVGFHSVIYKDEHVEDAYKHMREGHVGGCGITEEVSQWMENIQNSAVEELPVPMSKDDVVADPKIGQAHLKQQRKATKIEAAAKMLVDKHNNKNKADNDDGRKKLSSGANATTVTVEHPPKKYAHGASDDFKYPFEKYTKEANYRFEDAPAVTAVDDVENDDDVNVDDADYDDVNMNASEMDEVRKAFEKAASQVPFKRHRRMAEQFGDFKSIKHENNNWHERVHERIRRASGMGNDGSSSRREDNKNTCSLYIQTDPLIWRHIREGIADHDRGRKNETDVKTREEITSLIAHHITAVNYIYSNTKFDGRTDHRNIRFEVQRIKIDDDSACHNINGPHNAFCNEHMDVSNFLNLHSLEDHSDFCLAYVFTYRDFTGGTLGLAWVASASGASGGICEKYKTYTETVGGQYQSTKRSLNTGIITFVNYNSRVPPKVSQLTLAHEIGHNFGSPHDYPQKCRPGGLNGNFIMFASATSGDRPNNSKFSECSISNISNVLDVLVGNSKRDCFKASEGAFCGNKIVESGEECDCGFNEDECKDKCCYPRIISEYDMSLNSSAQRCRRRAKTQCSRSEGPCCLASSCSFVTTAHQQKCKEETECSWSSYCDGTTAKCPKPQPRDDKTKCNNGTALCMSGECTGSICLLWNMSKCFLSSQIAPHVDKRKLCELACQNGNDTSTCRSTSEFAHLYGLPEGGISLRPGSPCDNFQGYCDVFLKCRAVDADGPLVRLKKVLLNRETLLTVAQWITENWYMVVLMGIGFIIVMGIFIKCCAVHTPSSNPKKRRARRISETLRAPMNTIRRMRHHPHGRGAGPRSIPPPAHESRSHHHGHHHRSGGSGGGGAVNVPLPATGGSSRHHGMNNARNSSVAGARGSRGNPSASGRASTSAAANNSRSGQGYADGPPTAVGQGQGAFGVGLGTAVAGSGAALSRAQMPLPMPPTMQQQQQQQQQQQVPVPQVFYAPPKGVVMPTVNYNNRPSSVHNPDVYVALGRGGAYEQMAGGNRMPNAKV